LSAIRKDLLDKRAYRASETPSWRAGTDMKGGAERDREMDRRGGELKGGRKEKTVSL